MSEGIKLGERHTMKTHGIDGVVTAEIVYLNMTTQYKFEWVRKDGGISAQWVEATELRSLTKESG